MLRHEADLARLAMVANVQSGLKAESGKLFGFYDFAPHLDEPEEPVANEDDMKRFFGIKK